MINQNDGQSNKRRRTEGKEDADDEVEVFAGQRRFSANRLPFHDSLAQFGSPSVPMHGGDQSANQNQILQGSLAFPSNIATEALLSAGNYPLVNPNSAALRGISMPARRSTEPYVPAFLGGTGTPASMPNLGFLDPSLPAQAAQAAQAGMFGQQGFLSTSGQGSAPAQVQAQAHAQAQAQSQVQAQAQAQAQAQVQMQAQMQLQAHAQVQARAAALNSTAAQRGLRMQSQTAFRGANTQASQIPNLQISMATSPTFAMPMESPLFQGHGTSNMPNESSTKHSTSAVSAASVAGAATAPSAVTGDGGMTGRAPVILYMPCDDAVISRYQCLARKQMEVFEAQEIDVEAGAQGRNKGIVLGQVEIRCIHCRHLYPRRRTKSSTFYPSKLKSIYQTAQNMANTHLTQTCQYIPKPIRDELQKLSQDKKTSAGGGKEYWSDGARILGVYETESYLRFKKTNDYPGSRRPSDGSKAGQL